ncbi:MAG: hypothetical protein LBO79_04665, partial [Zoogloeaceae bacterium]|nr:hypothetical protein [Zoogloeaceae bacterium]
MTAETNLFSGANIRRFLPQTKSGRGREWRFPYPASFFLLLLALGSHAPALPLAAWPCLFLALSSRLLPRRAWAAGLRLLFLAGVVLAFGFSHGWL